MCVVDGDEELPLHLLLRFVLRKQQNVETGVRRRKSAKNDEKEEERERREGREKSEERK